MKKLILSLMILLSQITFANNSNVILITFDGVRSHEFYRGTSKFSDFKLPVNLRGNIFNYLHGEFLNDGVLYGRAGVHSTYKVADKFGISLPSYQTIFVGKDHGLGHNNRNPQVRDETFPERLKRELNLSKKSVAVFTSWSAMDRAVAANPENIFVNVGVNDVDDGTDDSVIRQLNLEQKLNPPGWDIKNSKDRSDEYTWSHAIHYLKKHQPRFLYISLLDSDEYAHNGDYKNYVLALKSYDEKIKQLNDLLEGELKDYGKNTTILITTDHSRSWMWLWRHHGLFPKSERNIFLAAKGPNTRNKIKPRKIHNHFSIRPTIEKLFGLTPATNGKILTELLP